MFRPHHLRHMGGVERQGLHRLLPRLPVDEAVKGVDSHHTTAVPDGPQLLIRQVPGFVAQRRAVGVGGQYRPLRHLQGVPETPAVQVGDIQDHPPLPHSPYRPASQICEPPVRVAPGSGGQGVFPVPSKHPQPHAEVRVAVDALQVCADGVHALHCQKGIQLPRRPGCLRLPGGAHHRQPWTFRKFRPGRLTHDLRAPCGALRSGNSLPERLPVTSIRPQCQYHTFHAAPAQPRQMTALQHPLLP